jgi:hypothetical protein
MKKILPFVFLFAISIVTKAQITVDHNDMPNTGDTIRLSITTDLTSIDYTQTGVDFTWDFSSLGMFSQRVDTFMSVLSTPITYIATFSNPFDQTHFATIAGTQPSYPSMPNISISEVYNFYKETSASYSQVGIGAKVNSIPLPIKYSTADVQLTFPLTYGEKDSCDFEFNVSIPSLGYYGEKKHRVNYVDGWGSMITPLDTFPVMLVRSEIDVHDTVFADTLGFGFATNHKETEYKWYADMMSIPVMKISKRSGFGGSTTAEYIDKVPDALGVTETHLFKEQILIAPNPASDRILLRYYSEANGSININIIDVCGKIIFTKRCNAFKGLNDQAIDVAAFKKGIYFINLQSDQSVMVSRFVKE